MRLSADWQERLRLPALVVLTLAAVGLALVVGYALPQRPMLVVAGVFLILVMVVALAQPMLLPVVAMPVVVVVSRFGAGGVEMTISDWMLGLAFWPAVLFGRRPLSPELRSLLWLNAAYQALTIFTLIVNPYLANTVEWFHAWLLVSGALIVGWAVGAAGYARLGVKLFLAACVALALPTIAQALMQYAQGDFSEVYPRWPWPMHKNFIGNLLGIAAVVVYARPRWLGLSRRWAIPVLLIFLAAMAASQARQALVGLAIGLLVVSLRKHGERRRATVAMATALPIGYIVLTMIRDQIASGNIHNSWFQRLEWYAESVAIWREAPLFGHGLRYWTQPDAPGQFQPPNAFLEVMASTGLAGLLGFVVLWIGIVVVLTRMNPAFGTLALALALTRLGQSMFDLFWVSIAVSVPFLLIGVCLGAAHRASTKADSLPSVDRTKDRVGA